MISGDPNCFGHPTKVTFTFSEKCLKNDRNADYPPFASYWSAAPYQDGSTYNIQSWLAHKMKNQRQKIRLERAVQRAEKKLQIEYDKQMELKRKAADQRFKMWLKSKGFANQSPVMLDRTPQQSNPENSSALTPGNGADSKRPKTARVRSLDNPRGSSRPRSASAPGNRRQITSTLDIKPVKPKPTCKALVQDDFMKMRHLAGKRYKKLRNEKFGFQCEDQILRKLQDLDWEEKCIKSKKIFSEKEDLGKVKAKALKLGKKKLKFKGDVITVEVEEIESNADVDITFEEVDDKCSDIGCIEKEGVDFHIESRESIDLSDKADKEPCRPMTAEPPKTECEETPPCAPSRPKSSKHRSVDKEGAAKKEVAKEASADSKKSAKNEKKQAKEDKSQTDDVKSSTKKKKDSNADTVSPKVASSSPKEKESSKKAKSPAKEEASSTPSKEKDVSKKAKPSTKEEASSTPSKEKESSKKAKPPPKEEVSSKSDQVSPNTATPSPKKDNVPAKEKDAQDQAKKGSAEKSKDVTSGPKENGTSKKEPAPPTAEKESQKVKQSSKDEATEKKSIEEESSKKAEKVDTEKLTSPKKAEKAPTEKVTSPKEAEKSTIDAPKPPSEKSPKSKDSADKKITPNGKVLEEKNSTKDEKSVKENTVKSVKESAVADPTVA